MIWLRPFERDDVQSFNEVFLNQCYPPPSGGGVLDAGANIRCFSVMALASGEVKRVVTIAPSRKNIPLLKRNLGCYGERARLVNATLWDSAGFAPFSESNQSNTGRLGAVTPSSLKSEETVMVRTVAPTSKELPPASEITYLKMDIEGAEDMVLPYYLRNMPSGGYVACELHGQSIELLRPLLEDHWTVIEEAPSRVVFIWQVSGGPESRRASKWLERDNGSRGEDTSY